MCVFVLCMLLQNVTFLPSRCQGWRLSEHRCEKMMSCSTGIPCMSLDLDPPVQKFQMLEFQIPSIGSILRRLC